MTSDSGVRAPCVERLDHIACLAEDRSARLDHDGRPRHEPLVHLTRVGLMRAHGDDDGVGAHQRPVEQRCPRRGAAADEIRLPYRCRNRRSGRSLDAGRTTAKKKGLEPIGVARDDLDPIDRPHRTHRLNVAPRLRPGSEHEQPRSRRLRQMPHRERRHRRRPQRGQRDPVDEPRRCQRVGVEQHVEPLDPRQSAFGIGRRDRGQLDAHGSGRAGRHREQLPRRHVEHRTRRIEVGVEAVEQRALERVDRVSR